MDFSNFWWQAAAAPPVGIGNSLRFRGAQRLQGPAVTASASTKGTFSTWVKLGNLSVVNTLFGAQASSGSAVSIDFHSDNYLRVTQSVNGNYPTLLNSGSIVFRDPFAWYHVVVAFDGTQADANRVKAYINGAQITLTGSSTSTTWWFQNQPMVVGVHPVGSAPLEGYLSDTYFVEGQVLQPTDFGEFDANGVWTPKQYTGTYGTNGWYLSFSDGADIGKDYSGNGNDFTATGFDLDPANASPTYSYDYVADSPTVNKPLFNALLPETTAVYAKGYNANMLGGLNLAGRNTWGQLPINTPITGRKYIEFTAPYQGSGTIVRIHGVVRSLKNTGYPGDSADSWGYVSNPGSLYNNGASTPFGPTYGDDIVVGVAFDADTYELQFFLNGAKVGTTQTLPAGTYYFATGMYNSANYVFGLSTDLKNAAPAGYEQMDLANLPAAPIRNGRDHFRAITDTGANILTAAQAAFPNGLWWIKDRANANQHQLVDSVNGTTDVIQSPARTTGNTYAAPAGNSVAWCWATPAGGINTTAGFSITNGTHGLNEVPEFVIDRNLNVFLASVTAGNGFVLSSDAALAAQPWTVNATTVTGPAGGTYYAWHSVPGYSAFGSYTGNGSANGPFIYTGFRPAFVLIKANSSYDWIIVDSTRDPSNPCNNTLIPNKVDVEAVGTPGFTIDMLSNGFKIRNNGSTCNLTNNIYHYAAFAENPFGGSNVAPATAR